MNPNGKVGCFNISHPRTPFIVVIWYNPVMKAGRHFFSLDRGIIAGLYQCTNENVLLLCVRTKNEGSSPRALAYSRALLGGNTLTVVTVVHPDQVGRVYHAEGMPRSLSPVVTGSA